MKPSETTIETCRRIAVIAAAGKAGTLRVMAGDRLLWIRVNADGTTKFRGYAGLTSRMKARLQPFSRV